MARDVREVRRLHHATHKGGTAVSFSDLMPYILGFGLLSLAIAGKWELIGAIIQGFGR